MATEAFVELLDYCIHLEGHIKEGCKDDLVAGLELAELMTESEEIIAAALVDTYPPPKAAAASVEKVASLLAAASTGQRTPEWYAESMNLLTASELGNLFKSPRTRALMVMSKTAPPTHSSSARPVDSSFMTAFDWGIRFEPVVKALYEWRHLSTVAEVGRLRHPTLARCAASPDGIVCAGSRAGRLLEIKCPVTREPGPTVPDDYYAQIQQQLEVCDLEECDYVEVKFRAPYSSAATLVVEGPVQEGMFGIVWRLDREDAAGITSSRYLYETPGSLPEVPSEALLPGEVVMERVVYEVITWNEITVRRNRDWWLATLPKIEAFWEDVEKARQGAFVVPEARPRKAKPEAEEKCMIVLSPKSS
jgi:hypothetical protein